MYSRDTIHSTVGVQHRCGGWGVLGEFHFCTEHRKVDFGWSWSLATRRKRHHRETTQRSNPIRPQCKHQHIAPPWQHVAPCQRTLLDHRKHNVVKPPRKPAAEEVHGRDYRAPLQPLPSGYHRPSECDDVIRRAHVSRSRVGSRLTHREVAGGVQPPLI